MQYALDLNSPFAQGYGPTQGGFSPGTASLTYRKITTATQLQYEVEQSTDLVTWTPVTTQDQVVDTRGNVQTIQANVAVGANTSLFLRLRITQQ